MSEHEELCYKLFPDKVRCQCNAPTIRREGVLIDGACGVVEYEAYCDKCRGFVYKYEWGHILY